MDTGRLPPRLVHRWVAVVVLLSAAALVVYVVGQQMARRTVDDGPRALLDQTRGMLAAGASPAAITAGPVVDLDTSSAMFLIIYDADHVLLASSAALAGSSPQVPPGVLDEAVVRGEDRVTWQPAAGVREAVVASPWQSATSRGVVVAGTSLTTSESRTGTLRGWVGLTWLLAVLTWTAILGRPAVRSLAAGVPADSSGAGR